MAETLTLLGGAAGLQALLARAERLDASALVRLRRLPGGMLDVFVTTPFDVVAARRAEGEVSRDGAVVGIRDALDAVVAHNSSDPTPRRHDIGAPRDPSWPGALPPATGFTLLDEVPVLVARQLADEGRRLARQFSGPMGPPQSLLNQDVLTVHDPNHAASATVPMRMIFTCTSLGLIPGLAAPTHISRHLRVSTCGRWVRVDAFFGTVYHARSLSLV